MPSRRFAASLTIVVSVIACSGSAGSSASSSASAAASAIAVASPATRASEAPVGRWITFVSGGISRVQADGSHESEIISDGVAPSPAHPDTSPDGRLAFQAGEDGSWDIWIADADGRDPRVLVDCSSPCISMDAPAWSPDGTTIAFSELDEIGDTLPSKLQLVNVATGIVTTVADFSSGEYVTGPRWSPDGQRLVVTDEDHHGSDGALVEDPIDSRIAVIAPGDTEPALSFLTDAGMEASYPDWHPTRDTIVFQAGPRIWWDAIGESASNIFTIRADASGLQQITRLGPEDRAIWMPTWSADGESILVTLTVRATRENTIARLLPDGSGLADLPGPVRGAHPRQQRTLP